MPKGPRGEKRPADVIGCAIMTARISTGEIKEVTKPPSGKTRSGIAGAKARLQNTSEEQRSSIAKQAAEKRWN